jgi:hypothetical protein
MPGEKTYTLAIGKWPRVGIVTIHSVSDTKIARFPISFLASCGDNTWGYVSFVVSLLVEADPQHPASIIDPKTGQPVNPDDVPVAGMYRFVEQGAFIRAGLSEPFSVLRLSSTTRAGATVGRGVTGRSAGVLGEQIPGPSQGAQRVLRGVSTPLMSICPADTS